ncbi:LysR family transcriptional regulator [Streptomyces sp. 769]|nr:LysR family transcriptional regulator [Streptomyces sp. 769]
MDLLSLRYFRAVARREHISRAAEELRVAQPSVSRTIARLEAELGVPLFDRQGRTVRLNRYGAAFLVRVERALDELDDARRELHDAAGTDQGSVAIAAETLMPLAHLLGDFRAAYPGVAVRLLQSTPETMLDQLRTREVDFCVASQPLDGPGLEAVRLRREEVQLVVPAGHRLADRERVSVGDLFGEPFITTGPGHWQRVLLDRLFAPTGRRPGDRLPRRGARRHPLPDPGRTRHRPGPRARPRGHRARADRLGAPRRPRLLPHAQPRPTRGRLSVGGRGPLPGRGGGVLHGVEGRRGGLGRF